MEWQIFVFIGKVRERYITKEDERYNIICCLLFILSFLSYLYYLDIIFSLDIILSFFTYFIIVIFAHSILLPTNQKPRHWTM